MVRPRINVCLIGFYVDIYRETKFNYSLTYVLSSSNPKDFQADVFLLWPVDLSLVNRSWLYLQRDCSNDEVKITEMEVPISDICGYDVPC